MGAVRCRPYSGPTAASAGPPVGRYAVAARLLLAGCVTSRRRGRSRAAAERYEWDSQATHAPLSTSIFITGFEIAHSGGDTPGAVEGCCWFLDRRHQGLKVGLLSLWLVIPSLSVSVSVNTMGPLGKYSQRCKKPFFFGLFKPIRYAYTHASRQRTTLSADGAAVKCRP